MRVVLKMLGALEDCLLAVLVCLTLGFLLSPRVFAQDLETMAASGLRVSVAAFSRAGNHLAT